MKQCRGAEEAHRALPNEALYGDLRILGLIIPAYLRVFLPVDLQVKWRGAKPKTP